MGKRNKITSVAQMVNSYYVAAAIYELRDSSGSELISGTESLFFNKWQIDTKNERIKSLYKRTATAIRFNTKLTAIVQTCFEEMERFEFSEVASVSSNQNDNKNLRSSFSLSEFDILRKTTLLDHSLNVLEEMLDILEGKEVYGAGPLIIAAMLHDFGKAKKIRELATPDSVSENSTKFRMHAEVSTIYTKDIFYEKVRDKLMEKDEDTNIRQTVDNIADLVANHHNSSKAWKKKVELINMADSKARKKEILKFEKR